MQLLKVSIFYFYHTHTHTHTRVYTFEKHRQLACSLLFLGDIPSTWGTAEYLIFTLAVLRAPGLTLSLITQPVESVYSVRILSDSKSRWATLLERVEFNRIGQDRNVENIVVEMGYCFVNVDYYMLTHV